jgi:hypothetical protein
MDEPSPILRKKNNFPWRNFFEADPLDGNQVTVQESRRHARAEDAQSNLATGADDFLDQFSGHMLSAAHAGHPVDTLRSLSAEPAVVLVGMNLSAGQRRCLKNLFAPEGGRAVRLFRGRLRTLFLLSRRMILFQVSCLLPASLAPGESQSVVRSSLDRTARLITATHFVWLSPAYSPSSSHSRYSKPGSGWCCRYR